MTAEKLVAMIKQHSSALLPHFEGEDGEICLRRVQRVVELPDQRELERVIDTMIKCDSRRTQIEIQIYELTSKLREELDEINISDNDAMHRLYEMRNEHELDLMA